MAGAAGAAAAHRSLAESMPLAEVCAHLLSAAGPLASVYPHWRESAVQMTYARRVAETLEAGVAPGRQDTAVAGLSADTGVGKTFGYLVPLIAYHARTGHRVAVATYSHTLIRQILGELTAGAGPSQALTALWSALGEDPRTAPTVALRAGMQEFVSPSRVDALIQRARLSAAERAELVRLRAWAKRSQHPNGPSGILRDYLQSHPPLPEVVTAADLFLTSQCSTKTDAAAYERHLARAGKAQLLICTHAALLRQARRGHGLWASEEDDLRVRAVVADEADHIPQVAASILGTYLPMYQLRAEVGRLANAPTRSKAYRAHVERLSDALSEIEHQVRPLLPKSNRPREMLRAGSRARTMVTPLIEEALEACDGFRRQSRRWAPALGSSGRMFLEELFGNLRDCLSSLKSPNDWRVPYLRITPVREWVGVGVQPRGPGALLGGLWTGNRQAKLDSLILTSATLAAPGADGLKGFFTSVGLKAASPRIVCSESFEPEQHGEIDLVLCDPRVPRPVRGVDEDGGHALLDDDWLAYAATMVREAASRGGRVLVLATSYGDVAAIDPHLAGVHNLLLHRSSDDRGGLIETFRSRKSAVYVSPAAWEGLDLPNLITDLVILRVPFPPRDSAEFVATTSWAGTEPGEGHLLRAQSVQAVRRLRQGIGRVLRQPDSKARVWIADRRFPLPSEVLERMILERGMSDVASGGTTLLAALPQRFRAGRSCAYRQARVFTIDGNVEGF